ncbi:M4 family metallopeptidase [Streptosporangium sandarakinum]|uniref:M4 family metallopeptidase n=1 Tax=Streptosporangium sandarakinum TaxID=1260955 RepID=UPI00341DB48D
MGLGKGGKVAVALLVVCGVVTAFTVPAAAKPAPPNTPAAILADKPAFLHASSHDRFVQRSATDFEGMKFLVYDRTYKGLKVVGGQFVLVTDRTDRVIDESVAQTRSIGDLSVTPKLSAADAETAAKGQLTSVSAVEGTRLAVRAVGDTPRLVWETTVTGTGTEGPSSLTVQVDALTGAVLDSQEHIHYGVGNSGWNGTVSLDTTLSGGVYSMNSPATTNMPCQDSATNVTFSGPDDVFGNGDPADRETGCVDALYGAQGEMRMMKEWLGRDGIDGSGGAVPIRVGLQMVNAFYQDGKQVQIGHNKLNGQWIGDIDVVAHELGHGVDYKTGGGLSAWGTAEFIGDAFGAATEVYLRGKTDWLVGAGVNLRGDGAPIRSMYDPPLKCYDGGYYEEHYAAGVGNHWFYLLTEGSNPTNGQPVSPTCNGSTTTSGIGIQNAMKIVYMTMLSNAWKSNYMTYRAGTVKSAKTLDPTGALCRATKAAWDAVSVPVQPKETTC